MTGTIPGAEAETAADSLFLSKINARPALLQIQKTHKAGFCM